MSDNTSEVRLSLTAMGQAIWCSHEAMNLGVDPRLFIKEQIDHMTIGMKTYIYGETERTRVFKVSYPANWKEAFLERWMPRRMRRWRPIKYEVKTCDVQAYYPDFKPAIPKNVGKDFVLHLKPDSSFELKGARE